MNTFSIKNISEKTWGFIKRFMWPALYESVFILLISNASLFVLILMHVVTTKGAKLSTELLGTVVTENVQSPEILVYVLALVAPAAWIMISNWRGKRHLTFYWILFFLQAIIVLGSAIIYSLAKSSGIENKEFVDDWALMCVFVGVFIWYITLVYDKWIPTVADERVQESGLAILKDLERKE